MTERCWIWSRSRRRSWKSWKLVNRASVHGLERCGQRDGVSAGKVILSTVGWWSDKSEKEQTPVCTLAHHGRSTRSSHQQQTSAWPPMTEEVFVELPSEANLPEEQCGGSTSHAARLPLSKPTWRAC